VRRGAVVLFTAGVTLVAVSDSGQPVRLPATLRQKTAPLPDYTKRLEA